MDPDPDDFGLGEEAKLSAESDETYGVGAAGGHPAEPSIGRERFRRVQPGAHSILHTHTNRETAVCTLRGCGPMAASKRARCRQGRTYV